MSGSATIRVPATSANLGCLFDCAALALGLYLDLHVIPCDDCQIEVQYTGVTPERVPCDESNLIARTISQTLASWNKKQGFKLDIQNQIPIGVGLGSSAAAIVAALAAAYFLKDHFPTDDQILSAATEIEGHPDNAAAAWHGGFTLAAQQNGAICVSSCPMPDNLLVVVTVPDYALPTEKARQALPDTYSRADAVHNLQRAASLAARIFSGRMDIHPLLFDDRWHQPYRAPLVPGLSALLELRHPDLAGLCLSGGGPSVLAFVRHNGEAVGATIRQILADHGVKSQSYLLPIDNRGAKGWSRPA
ncbi:MAG: homoserine kinase [Terriglobia bacterium]